ncbi:heavy metal-binding domain-containing protein [Arthrobacter sp. zg-Y820]|uniref:heavy metal-binding domain-containing protein n=1 Tax=unclassified Arthrobacter TaxID=235627 RepID=UPI001E381A03|nr:MULTISPECIES: heavy metal-binding domain-containing protein [unclassified Arthrobacter]MCC9195302.1 heavy metal-binding domain-containing protein [Arthrobacter sp. zg-Y820]MDK1278161.1 heavy metal-binding domain-containing protein [Arthrobacter sp. zg.Y820]MDK1361361.1 heavy metal-binding domain-containing protein [Arthrobacter sp. zg-Y1219]WIB10047.1 heavy metal-binding domain-containing protein [Arthrobacter sp. zg-Y820]
MKTKDIAKNLGLELGTFDAWVKQSGYPYKSGLTGIAVADDVNVDELVGYYREYLSQEQARLSREHEQLAKDNENAARAAQEKQRALASMLITSGFNFDGYSITKYSGYISGDDAVSMNRPTHGWLGGVNGEVGADLLAGLAHIRRNALAELKEAAYALGCNAVIGVDFDYLTMDPETASSSGGTLYLPFLFAVTANGNAVMIEKN